MGSASLQTVIHLRFGKEVVRTVVLFNIHQMGLGIHFRVVISYARQNHGANIFTLELVMDIVGTLLQEALRVHTQDCSTMLSRMKQILIGKSFMILTSPSLADKKISLINPRNLSKSFMN